MLASRATAFCSSLSQASFKRVFRTSQLISRASWSTRITLTQARSMSISHHGESSVRPEPDKVLQDIADYVYHYQVTSDLAYETARLCLIDTIGCGLEGLRFPDCASLMGPVVEGTIVPNGFVFHSLPVMFILTNDKAPKFLAPTISSIPFAVHSILVP